MYHKNKIITNLKNSPQKIDSPPHHLQIVINHEKPFSRKINSFSFEHNAVNMNGQALIICHLIQCHNYQRFTKLSETQAMSYRLRISVMGSFSVYFTRTNTLQCKFDLNIYHIYISQLQHISQNAISPQRQDKHKNQAFLNIATFKHFSPRAHSTLP